MATIQYTNQQISFYPILGIELIFDNSFPRNIDIEYRINIDFKINVKTIHFIQSM